MGLAASAEDIDAVEKKIAVLEFASHGVSDAYAKAVRNTIEVALFEKKLHVLERKNLARVLFETGDASPCRDGECAVRQGKIVSADYAIVGDVTHAGSYLTTVRVVDVTTGKIVFADSITTEEKEELLDASRKIADRLSGFMGKRIKKEKAAAGRKSAQHEDGTASPRFYCDVKGGHLQPAGYLRKKATVGYAVSLTTGVAFHGMVIGSKTGFYRLHRGARGPFADFVPLMIHARYDFTFSRFFAAPGLSLGATYLRFHATSADSFEPMVNPSFTLGYRPSAHFHVALNTDYHYIIQKKKAGHLLHFGIGAGFML